VFGWRRLAIALSSCRLAAAIAAHEGVPSVVVQRQLGHANLGITSVYLQGIDSSEIISTVDGRHSATISAAVSV
jgi:integrase